MAALLILAIFLPMMLAAAFLLGRHLHRRQRCDDPLSLVTRQHIYLFQGGQLNEELVESTKKRLRLLLEHGELATVEAGLRPGVQYVIQVRALTDIGTEDAGLILERQLQRRLTDDQLEQSWYWLDSANGLRLLNREESLPHLLRCAAANSDLPLGHFFAAETVCFLGFSGYLQQTDAPLGNAALRVLHRALEGLRHGVQPQMVIEARLGEAIERLWDHRPERIDPLLVRVAVETLRLLRRAPQAQTGLIEEGAEHESFHLQVSRLAALEPVLVDYLEEAPALLCRELPRADRPLGRDIIAALMDLRADTAAVVLPMLERHGHKYAGPAIETLTWSKDSRVGPWLCRLAQHNVPALCSTSSWRLLSLPRTLHTLAQFPLVAVLRALRGHPGKESEQLLLQAFRLRSVECRQAAVGSIGWWEPIMRQEVLACLSQAQRDGSTELRLSARAAAARLGDRQALHWFRQSLTSEDPHQVHEAIQTIAAENLMLLWPDLDYLTDADNPDISHHAREAVQRLFEEMEFDMRS